MFTASRNPEDPHSTQTASVEPHRTWEDRYRQRWRWDKIAWGTHCVDCYPGNCTFRVYVKDGAVLREEQAGTFQTVEQGVPDMNPMGCQKGASWSQQLYSEDRLLYPMKRLGERGEGKWQRISWDEAITEVADAIIDAIQEVGPESIICEGSPEPGAALGRGRFTNLIGGVVTDIDGEINDFSTGLYITFGKFNPVSSVDDWFHSELIFIWHMNPAYTRIPWYHFVAEARYHGAEVVTIAPDFSPSAVHADYHVPVKPGCDAALALAMCRVIIDEGLYDAAFVKDQTDLPLLVRQDNHRFLRASDVQAAGRDDQFYFWDAGTGQVVEAPRDTLALGDIDPALEGSYSATLADGTSVAVTPAFELLKERLRDYAPEKASQICGIHPEVIRTLARKAAGKKTNILMGWNSCKYYHGDLMERSMCLLLGLTGNWGKKGTGIRSWSVAFMEAFMATQMLRPGLESVETALALQDDLLQAVRAEDPTMTEEMAAIELSRRAAAVGGMRMAPPVFFWYYHCGYREIWNRREWSDPSMVRPFDEYLQEVLDKGWWEGVMAPRQDSPPRVLLEVGGNYLRRIRGGQTMLLKHLWPQLKMIVSVDWRINTTGLFSDILLPAANHYEKVDSHIPTPHILNFTFSDQAAAPPGEAKDEWEIFSLLARKVEERAKARGLAEIQDRHAGTRRLDNLHQEFTLGGRFAEREKLFETMMAAHVAAGTLPEETTVDTLRQKGWVRFTDWGKGAMALNQASDLKPDETHSPFRWHVEKKLPYPSLTRRAQFYIDHPWFLEASEELPTHKDAPKMGGDYPFVLTSGHPRWSIHAMNMTNKVILQTHRGHPFAFINPRDAEARSIEDDEDVRVFNDMGSIVISAKLSSAVCPGQVIIYNGFEPYMCRGWQDAANLEPGMIKWLHLVGDYGHLRYWPMEWQPVQVDRAVRVDLAKA